MTEIQIQKCLHLSKELAKKNPKLQGNYLITPKKDGWFTYIVYDKILDTWLVPKSSANRIIPSLEHTVTMFNRLPRPHNSGMLIAEVYVPETPFHITNGMLNRTIGDYQCSDAIFACHDWVEFGSTEDALTRFNKLRYLIDDGRNPYMDKIFRMPLLQVSAFDRTLWQLAFEDAIEAGDEGIVAKRANSLYSYGKRNSDLVKLKLECTIDTLADRVEIAEGEKGNLSVTLISKRKNGAEIRTVINSHKYQQILIDTPNQILGKVVTIKAMEEYADGQLRQPVFNYPRPDKEIDDYD